MRPDPGQGRADYKWTGPSPYRPLCGLVSRDSIVHMFKEMRAGQWAWSYSNGLRRDLRHKSEVRFSQWHRQCFVGATSCCTVPDQRTLSDRGQPRVERCRSLGPRGSLCLGGPAGRHAQPGLKSRPSRPRRRGASTPACGGAAVQSRAGVRRGSAAAVFDSLGVSMSWRHLDSDEHILRAVQLCGVRRCGGTTVRVAVVLTSISTSTSCGRSGSVRLQKSVSVAPVGR